MGKRHSFAGTHKQYVTELPGDFGQSCMLYGGRTGVQVYGLRDIRVCAGIAKGACCTLGTKAER